MTVEEFMIKEDINNYKLISKWINKKYIPGVTIDENGEFIIPDNARVPYTERGKCKKGYSMLKSFVKAYCNGKNVVPELYGITIDKFNSINGQLEEWGLIVKENLDGLVYYNATPLGAEFIAFTNTQINKFLQQAICSVFKGVTDSFVDRIA